MSNVYYLPTRQRPAPPAQSANDGARPTREPKPLRIAVPQTELASVLTKETLSVGGGTPPRAAALLASLPTPTARTRNVLDLSGRSGPGGLAPGLGRNHAMGRRAVAATNDGADGVRLRRAVSHQWSAKGVLGGRLILAAPSGEPGPSFTDPSRDALLQRRGSGNEPAFAFADQAALEETASRIIFSNRTVIEGWLRRGMRPPLVLRYLAPTPFGAILHAEADQPSPMRGIAVVLQDRSGSDLQWTEIEFSLNPR